MFVKFHFLFCLCLTVIQLLYVWVCFRSAFLSSAQQSNSTSCWIIKQCLEGMLSFCTASKFVGCVGQFLWLSKVGNPAFMATLCSIWSGLWRWRVCLNSVYAAININSCAKNLYKSLIEKVSHNTSHVYPLYIWLTATSSFSFFKDYNPGLERVINFRFHCRWTKQFFLNAAYRATPLPMVALEVDSWWKSRGAKSANMTVDHKATVLDLTSCCI